MAKEARGQTILIVEDDSESAVAVGELLRNEGYGVLAADNGADAVDIAAATHPELVLLDVRLPVLNGYEVLAELRRRRIPTRVVVYSGYEKSAEQVVALMRAGACGHVVKGRPVATLLEQIRRALAMEPTLDTVARADLVRHQVGELESRVKRLEHERRDLLKQTSELEAALRAAQVRHVWTGAVVKLVYLTVAVLVTYVLVRVRLLPPGVAVGLLPVGLLVLLLLPMDRVTKFTARIFGQRGEIRMGGRP